LRPHARGGLGVVSVALDEELHREVALKEIQERYAGEEQSRTRFTLEAEITGGLEHPWLADEPVLAYREPWRDRARRWSRRHRTLVASAAAVLVVGLIGSAGFAAVVTGKNRDLARQTERAQAREQMAIDAVKRFRDVVIEEPVLKNNPALDELRKKLLKEPLAFFWLLRAQLQADTDTRPAALARLAGAAFELGQLTSEIGDKQDALRSYQESLSIRDRLARENPSVTEFQRDLAASHYETGKLQSETGHLDAAFQSYANALAIGERLERQNPSVNELQRDLAQIHSSIGSLHRDTGHPELALESYGESLAIRERLARGKPDVTEFQDELAKSFNNIGNVQLGILHNDTGQLDQAFESYSKALAIRERLAGEHPETPDYASNLGATLNNMAVIDLAAKRFQEARDKLRQAISCQKKALAAYPRHSTYRQCLGSHLTNLIKAANALGNDHEARAAQRELDELSANDPAKLELDQRLAAVIRGESSKDSRERLQLAYRAYEKKLFAASTRLFGEVLDSDPKLADDRQVRHRYNAACAAALAAVEKTASTLTSPIKGEEKTLRNRARTWLEAERATWTKLLGSANREQRRAIAKTLERWQHDTDLASVRDEMALDKLPEDERRQWKSLWADVDATLAEARQP
jgi:tetratricopeptide (TPR) repeat protein